MNKPVIKPANKKEEKEDRIFEATLQLIERVGLSGLSMEAIAKQAKMATGTVYIYFTSKEELLNALYTRTKLIFAESILRPCGSETPMRVCFRQVCHDYLRYLLGHNAELVFMHQFANSPYISESVKSVTLEYIQPLYRLLERGRKEMLLKDLDTGFMISFLNGAVSSISALMRSEPETAHKKYYELADTVCWDALKN